MSFTVDFYNVAKLERSTIYPTTGATALSCDLKEESGLISPTLQIDYGLTSRPDFNYCYIDDFGRWYYISEWRWIRHRLWEATLSIDVLATYKSTIGASYLYVLRAASEYDGSVIDDFYPTPTGTDITVTPVANLWSNTEAGVNIDVDTDGCFVLGIVSNSGTQYTRYGSMTYLAFTRDNLITLVNALLSNLVTTDEGFETASASLALQKAIVDPISYIKSCMWIPLAYDSLSGTEVTSGIDINGWTLSGVTFKSMSNLYRSFTWSVPLTKHPSASSRGTWLNNSPYTRYTLFVPPWGMFHLDTSLLLDESSIQITPKVDLITGIGTLIVEATTSKAELVYTKAQVGVPIQLSQINQNIVGGILNTAADVATAVATANPIAAIGAVGSAIDAITPHVSTIGGTGSFTDLCGMVTLYNYFAQILPDDNDHVGRPLCQMKTINTLSGYVKVLDGDIVIPGATDTEISMVKRYLEEGFFYE